MSATVRDQFGVVAGRGRDQVRFASRQPAGASQCAPASKWEFIVLDTEGVNAFAAPGGIVHITKGAARPDQERSGAGRRARPRDHAHHEEAHRQRDSEEQGDQDDDRGSRREGQRLLLEAGQRRVRQRRRTGIRSRRRGRCGSGRPAARQQGGIHPAPSASFSPS